ncbi:MAG TPA: ABC transporter substrate-binding protein [Dehalococcoidia bacterium]|nr:ABC transporter substrate-binding protein [Dehalococcoidia bacterium]
MAGRSQGKLIVDSFIMAALLLLVACGGAAATPVPPTATTALQQPTATTAPAATTTTPIPTPAAQSTSPPAAQPQTAKDKAVAVIAVEPEHLSLRNIDAHGGQLMDTISGYIGHVDRDTRKVAPSSLIKSWQQTAPNQWEYELRPGVTFHDGARWDVAAWQEYAKFAGVAEFPLTSFAVTGPYTVEEIEPLKARINCGGPCPLFEWGLYLSKTYSPKALQAAEFIDLREPAGAGPYKVVEWVPGTKIVTAAFEGFVPAPETPEFAALILDEIEWQWREETAVRAAMIEVGEADWAFLLSLDDAQRLGPERFVTGGTAEMAWFRIDTIWDPWLSKKEMRQAIVHAIDCQAIVDSLYQGTTSCRGNFGAPGVTGITEENIKPYEYDPDLSQQLLEQIGYICNQPTSAPNCEAEIKISSRSDRIANNEELVESMVSYLQDVGINAKAQFLEGSIRAAMRDCGIGIPGAQKAGWQGATESKKPPTCDPGQILDIIGTGYEDLDYGKFIGQRLLCEGSASTVCFPEREAEWNRAQELSGEERRQALEKVADTVHQEVLGLPLFDLTAIYGVNPKLRGFEQPRFDKHLFANLWWFAE